MLAAAAQGPGEAPRYTWGALRLPYCTGALIIIPTTAKSQKELTEPTEKNRRKDRRHGDVDGSGWQAHESYKFVSSVYRDSPI